MPRAPPPPPPPPSGRGQAGPDGGRVAAPVRREPERKSGWDDPGRGRPVDKREAEPERGRGDGRGNGEACVEDVLAERPLDLGRMISAAG